MDDLLKRAYDPLNLMCSSVVVALLTDAASWFECKPANSGDEYKSPPEYLLRLALLKIGSARDPGITNIDLYPLSSNSANTVTAARQVKVAGTSFGGLLGKIAVGFIDLLQRKGAAPEPAVVSPNVASLVAKEVGEALAQLPLRCASGRVVRPPGYTPKILSVPQRVTTVGPSFPASPRGARY